MAEVATAVYVGNVPLCWPLIQRVFQTGPWSRSSSGGGYRSGTGGPSSRLRGTSKAHASRLGGSSTQKGGAVWSITSRADPTPWAAKAHKDDLDLEDQSQRSNEYICPANVADDQTSTVELTSPWGGGAEGPHTEVHASRGNSSDGTAVGTHEGTFWVSSGSGSGAKKEAAKTNIVKTVEISTVSHAQ